jgi:hypothetical protein
MARMSRRERRPWESSVTHSDFEERERLEVEAMRRWLAGLLSEKPGQYARPPHFDETGRSQRKTRPHAGRPPDPVIDQAAMEGLAVDKLFRDHEVPAKYDAAEYAAHRCGLPLEKIESVRDRMKVLRKQQKQRELLKKARRAGNIQPE